MGEAKNRAADEAVERAMWADEIIADVLAIQAAAVRVVLTERSSLDGEGPIRDNELERVASLTTLGVLRSLGADVAVVADAIDAAVGDDEEEPEIPAPRGPLRLTTPKAAPGGILPE